MNKQAMVKQFHETFNILSEQTPTIPDIDTQRLRINLIEEELNELQQAFKDRDIVEIADAIADILYVTYGTAVSCGIDINPIFNAVHESNMTKVGGYFREDGKYMKPDTYEPVDILPLLRKQGWILK